MADDRYSCLRVRCDGGVAFVAIDRPPINPFDRPSISADPEFFIRPPGVHLIRMLPKEAPSKPYEPSGFHQMVECFRTMPKTTIGLIEDRARGGGRQF